MVNDYDAVYKPTDRSSSHPKTEVDARLINDRLQQYRTRCSPMQCHLLEYKLKLFGRWAVSNRLAYTAGDDKYVSALFAGIQRRSDDS